MASINDDPIRLKTPGPYRRFRLPTLQEIALPPVLPMRGSFVAALARRRSAHVLASISIKELATWLYYTASVQTVHIEDANRQQRFVGSFGALHPAHILLGGPDGAWCVYLPEKHILGKLSVDSEAAVLLRRKALQHFETESATLVALLGDRNLATNYYRRPDGLMLRDGGVLFGHGALVAAALGLAFRILGATGTPFLERLVHHMPFKPVASGLAWIGGSAT